MRLCVCSLFNFFFLSLSLSPSSLSLSEQNYSFTNYESVSLYRDTISRYINTESNGKSNCIMINNNDDNTMMGSVNLINKKEGMHVFMYVCI